jgi:hypothetical protein
MACALQCSFIVSAKVTSIDESISAACDRVPGVRNGALVLLPEGLLIGGIGAGSAFEREPLVRSAVRCLGTSSTLSRTARGVREFVEYAFVSEEQLIVVLRGQLRPRIALVLVCTRESNLAFVLSATRQALNTIETTVDLAEWEL